MAYFRALVAAAAASAVCAACTPASPGTGAWQKPGADEQTLARDNAQCREAAQDEAVRRYPYRAGSPGLGATAAVLAQQSDDNSRAVAAASLFNTCMQATGYSRAVAQ